MIVTYLEWMASLPWSKLAGGAIDIRWAREVLDEDHFDLEKIKDRILEYLGVKKLRQERSPVENVGRPFDRKIHKAVTMLLSDGVPPGTVGRELRRGWRLGEEQLRPAQIVVATSPETARSWR